MPRLTLRILALMHGGQNFNRKMGGWLAPKMGGTTPAFLEGRIFNMTQRISPSILSLFRRIAECRQFWIRRAAEAVVIAAATYASIPAPNGVISGVSCLTARCT